MTSEFVGTRIVIPSIQPDALPVSAIQPSPCHQACPAGINVKAYISLIAEGEFGEALETIRRRCPLPGICGRICHHPCERACRRTRYDEAVSIRALKRFAADHESDYPDPPPVPISHEERVAIIGSGPAGLTAAYDLRRAGYDVTIVEGEERAGGMLRYGIADYRLPPDVLDREIDVIRRAGVEIVTGLRIGRDLTFNELRARGYAAILIAVGAQRGRTLGLAGEEKTLEIEDALSFLRRVKGGDRTPLMGKVVVIGGGSTAVEAARTALRLGAKPVEILYRRYREELLADEEEIRAAEAEGVRFRFLISPKRILKKRGALVGLECVQVGLGEPDATGRRRPIEIPGSELTVDANDVLVAVGQFADFEFLPDDLRPASGQVAVDGATMTSVQGVFAAGDAVTGPATVIEAIAAGHRAAESIRSFIEYGAAPIPLPKPRTRELELPDSEPLRSRRIHLDLLHPTAAEAFFEVERAFTAEEAMAEARRCLRCGPCEECRVCASTCNRRHIAVRTAGGDAFVVRAPGSIALALDAKRATPAQLVEWGTMKEAELIPLRARIESDRCRACGRCVDACPFQALVLQDAITLDATRCRGCGICAAVCPTSAATMSAVPVVAGEAGRVLVLACERRAASLPLARNMDVLSLRCTGQIDAGMLLEAARQPFGQIVVAACPPGDCRFADGSARALAQLERARRMVRAIGSDPARLGEH
jgi:heterodisulfide reductase subunit A2